MRLTRRTASLHALLTASVLTVGLLSGSTGVAAVEPAATDAAPAEPVVVVAAGDIACERDEPRTRTTCRQAGTARLAAALDPDAVFALGDLQYPSGSLHDFRTGYDTSWGRLRAITYPVPGNHEYQTEGARGYYRYLRERQPGSPGYYAFDLGAWRVYALNSNCGEIRCRPQYRWLQADLEADPRTCALFVMHHPRYSSGFEHGSREGMSRFFSLAHRHGVDVVLAGDDHHYERFQRMNAHGELDPSGPLSFVAGTGGRSLYGVREIEHGSAYRRTGHFGVLRMSLHDAGYAYAFKDVNGRTPDRGRRACR